MFMLTPMLARSRMEKFSLVTLPSFVSEGTWRNSLLSKWRTKSQPKPSRNPMQQHRVDQQQGHQRQQHQQW